MKLLFAVKKESQEMETFFCVGFMADSPKSPLINSALITPTVTMPIPISDDGQIEQSISEEKVKIHTCPVKYLAKKIGGHTLETTTTAMTTLALPKLLEFLRGTPAGCLKDHRVGGAARFADRRLSSRLAETGDTSPPASSTGNQLVLYNQQGKNSLQTANKGNNMQAFAEVLSSTMQKQHQAWMVNLMEKQFKMAFKTVEKKWMI
mmetsp:Transcript_107896/g.247336  ORF Transcript_107896/g.247336 Transcript_107896/m.247336 type:complete len:206 (-) Transcript_107896:580-1197(-)